MIDCLTGKVIHIEVDSIVIDVHDIGYLVYCANPFGFQEKLNEKITVFTYQHVREDILRLYGFLTREEKLLFKKLLQVSGIGPKGALSILAVGEPKMVVSAIEEEDEKFLVKFPGVGKKTARQIILDLKGKLLDIFPSYIENEGGVNISRPFDSKQVNKELEEAIEALMALGYVDREINKVVPSLKAEELSTDAYIKLALKLMLNR